MGDGDGSPAPGPPSRLMSAEVAVTTVGDTIGLCDVSMSTGVATASIAGTRGTRPVVAAARPRARRDRHSGEQKQSMIESAIESRVSCHQLTIGEWPPFAP